MQAKQTRAAAQSAPQIKEQDDDETPRDVHAYRRTLARKISILVANAKKRWRSCGEPPCKRARACCAPRGTCSNRPLYRRPIKPEHEARNRARLYRSIREVGDRIDAERASRQTGDKSHQKS